MGFWVAMFIVSLILPVTFIILGWIFSKGAPVEINGLFGYRTRMSKKNEDTWDFAHMAVGKLWFIGGLILLPLSMIPSFFIIGRSYDVIGITEGIVVGCQILFIIASIICTEVTLRKHFDKDGNKIE